MSRSDRQHRGFLREGSGSGGQEPLAHAGRRAGAGLVLAGWLLAGATLPCWSNPLIFGENGDGGNRDANNYRHITACKHCAEQDGCVKKLLLYAYPAEDEIRVAIYSSKLKSDGTELPNRLLAQSVTQTAAPGWNAFEIPPVEIKAGTTYWLAYQVKDRSNTLSTWAFFDLDPRRTFYWDRFTWNAFPRELYPSLTPDRVGAFRYSFYAEMEPPEAESNTPVAFAAPEVFSPAPSAFSRRRN